MVGDVEFFIGSLVEIKMIGIFVKDDMFMATYLHLSGCSRGSNGCFASD